MEQSRSEAKDFVIAFSLILLGLIFLKSADFFTQGLVPVNDFGSNDLLIQDAKTFSLLHGNYSRVGFYHPGPFFFQIMAISEIVFVDWLGWFASPIGAHIFAGLFLSGASLAFLYMAFSRFFGSGIQGALATLITVVIAALMIDTRQFYLGQLFIAGIWPPFLYMTGAVFVLAGIVGSVSASKVWLPVLAAGLMMLVHGHASFIGLVPIMVCSMIAVAVLWRRSIVVRKDDVIAFIKHNRCQLIVSLVIIFIFIYPIALNTVINWPGEIPKYFKFSAARTYSNFNQVIQYLASFWHWSLLSIPVFFLVGFRKDEMKPAMFLSSLALGAVLPAALFYMVRGLDILDYKYPLFWSSIFVAGAAAVSIISTINIIKTNERKIILNFCVFVTAGYLLSGFNVRPLEYAQNKALNQAVDEIQKITPPGKYMWVSIDRSSAGAVVYILSLASIDSRTGRQSFCVEPESWDFAYTEKYKCDASSMPVYARLNFSPNNVQGDRVLFRVENVLGILPGVSGN